MLKIEKLFPGVSRMSYGLNRQSPLNAAKRHWITFLKYNSWVKMLNLARVLVQYAMKRPHIKGYPFFLKVEPTSRCNLKCRGCIAHGTDFPIEDGDMPLELFKTLCDEIGDYLYKISMYITGEPLLNKNIYEMIGYATQKRISTVISTNFHAFNEKNADRMINSGLTHIIICLDGLTQEVYGSYRVGGKVDTVLKNLNILMRKKAETGSKLPFVEIQAIRNEFNQEELPKIREAARELKADRFTIREDLRGYKPARRDRTCFWLWLTSLVTEKGQVLPCCASAWWITDRKYFGDLKKDSLRDIWNNENYRTARNVFSRRDHDIPGKRTNPLCSECTIFRCPK